MDDAVERAVQWGLSKSDGHPRVLAAEVRRLRARTDAVRAELEKAKKLTRESGIPVAGLVGLQLAVLCLDGEVS